MRRRVAVGAVLVAGLAACVVAVVVATSADPPVASPTPVETRTAAQLAPAARTPVDFARASCVRLRLAAQGVQADSSAEVVRVELAAARVLAAAALSGDGRWAALSGGVAALDEAVTRDDATAAALGLQSALAACPR